MRAFVALELPEKLKQRFTEVCELLRTPDAKVRWVAPENIHLTLKFLGDINDHQAGAIGDAVHAVSTEFAPFSLEIGGIGAFPNRRNPRVIWMGVSPNPDLKRLFVKIEKAATSSGVSAEGRSFSPHLTIGRVKFLERRSRLIGLLREVGVEPFFYLLDRLTLFESRLTPEGPVYRPVVSEYLSGGTTEAVG